MATDLMQHSIPFLFMRGGTSRGPYFNAADLPEDRDELSKVLIAIVGAGHPLNIDGLGGGNAVTTKVAMLSRSRHPDAEIDYFFAQVAVDKPLVDYGPTCGNILAGVGPAAIEMGLMQAGGDTTCVRVHAVNTGSIVEAEVLTPGGMVQYDGTTAIDGVPGTAAPVSLTFHDVVGSRTGAMFPTGCSREIIDGVEVSCVDVAMPMMIARATDFGLTGYESQEALDKNSALFAKMEAMRIQAGRRMGLGDVTRSVVPKIGLIASPRAAGNVAARYFMPWKAHPTLAVTGSQCLAACILAPETVAEGIVNPVDGPQTRILIEHPAGTMEVRTSFSRKNGFKFHSAGLTRTARLIARGEAMVPAAAWSMT